ncbi:MAG TPA: hypothetical protein VIS05_11230 [Ilumatobacter sp.]
MLVLVATTDTQGEVAGDYFQGVDGELVTPVTVECCVPDRCGCGRSFPGLVSARATTTALVVERSSITRALLRDAVADSLQRGGSLAGVAAGLTERLVDEHLDAIVRLAATFGEGAVLRRDGAMFWADVGRPAA